MTRYRLRALLIALPGLWLSCVVGAIAGLLAAGTEYLGANNVWFAAGWGTTFGVIPVGGMAAVLSDRRIPKTPIALLGAVWAAVGIASGISLYLFVVITASV